MRRVEVLHLLGTAAEEGTSIARIVKTLAAELDPAKFRLQAWFLGDDGPLRQELEGVGLVTRVFGWTRGPKIPWARCGFAQHSRWGVSTSCTSTLGRVRSGG